MDFDVNYSGSFSLLILSHFFGGLVPFWHPGDKKQRTNKNNQEQLRQTEIVSDDRNRRRLPPSPVGPTIPSRMTGTEEGTIATGPLRQATGPPRQGAGVGVGLLRGFKNLTENAIN